MRRGMLNRLITRFVYVFKPNLLKYLYVWIYECTEYRPCDNIEKQNYFSSRNYNKYESYFQQSFFKLQIIAIELLLLKPICYISICRFCFSIFTHRHPPKKKVDVIAKVYICVRLDWQWINDGLIDYRLVWC